MQQAGHDRTAAAEDASLVTTCGRRIAVRCLRLASADRPVSRIALDGPGRRTGSVGGAHRRRGT